MRARTRNSGPESEASYRPADLAFLALPPKALWREAFRGQCTVLSVLPPQIKRSAAGVWQTSEQPCQPCHATFYLGRGRGRGRGRGEEYRTMTREGHLDTSVRTELRSTLPVHLVGGPLARPCRIRSRSGVLRIALREGCREVFGDCRFELGSLGMFDTWLVDLGSEAGRQAGWLAG
jgi:hypothetical protein